ncbi:MAG: TetR/AcrR family transcriptional regulator [Pseudomonadales bacterium]
MSKQAHSEPKKTWQQTKSQNTRTTILEAALACFYRLGYSNTTTENIAKEAGLSRGAMLHHFANRFELVKGAIEHLSAQRLQDYAREEFAAQANATHTRVEDGIDVYWRQLNTPAFIVYHELLVAARTDAELREALQSAHDRFQSALYETSQQVFADLAQSEAFLRANHLTKYLLEGMAIARMTGIGQIPDKLMLDWLKNWLRETFEDVLTDDQSDAK